MDAHNVRDKEFAAIVVYLIHIIAIVKFFIEVIVNKDMTVTLRRQLYELDFFENRKIVHRLCYHSDNTSINQLRMSRSAFTKLCEMLETRGGLKQSKNLLVDEQVAMFLHVIAHHVKNRVITDRFRRSGETVSKYFNNVLHSIIRLHKEFLKKPEPITEDCNDDRWKCFKGCLGALDGTHIRVRVPIVDKARYRNRKGEITTNVLGVCSPDMQFIYVLPGWEGSAADSRILREALRRRDAFKVPHGHYYLVDAGYANSNGFLAPYRGQRYHLSEWRDGPQPRNSREFFNMKHSQARNAIERCFGVLKNRWAILRSPAFYPIKTQNRIIIACCLLHNYIRREISYDPFEDNIELNEEEEEMDNEDTITIIDSTHEWGLFRENTASNMYNEWRARREG